MVYDIIYIVINVYTLLRIHIMLYAMMIFFNETNAEKKNPTYESRVDVQNTKLRLKRKRDETQNTYIVFSISS